ncbi:hypothetical protein HD597_004037 [Nonomuraea thailandensis]|uniref:Uncharacterized protein n=1 Tax=Nonomuraea thailandensis TaxID=1188745 RepID=A0A9X2GDV5_9ACTN|nr:hypothetical protein [Nonomuraea thailandensis]MCP2357017.1 hypothetical protein [Nonomuraea thailandensis]
MVAQAASTSPACQLSGERADRHPDDVGEHASGTHQPQGAGARGRTRGTAGGHVGHRPERAGRQRRHEPRRQQQPEAGADRDDEMPGREHRDQQARLRHAHPQVGGDLRQQARDHELGRDHQEGAHRQHMDHQRQPRGRPSVPAVPAVPAGRPGVIQAGGLPGGFLARAHVHLRIAGSRSTC